MCRISCAAGNLSLTAYPTLAYGDFLEKVVMQVMQLILLAVESETLDTSLKRKRE